MEKARHCVIVCDQETWTSSCLEKQREPLMVGYCKRLWPFFGQANFPSSWICLVNSGFVYQIYTLLGAICPDTTRGVYEKKLLKLLEGGVQRDRAPPRISPLKNRVEEQQKKPMTHYSDEEEAEEVEEDEEEEDMDLETSADNFRESYSQQSNRYNNEAYSTNLTGKSLINYSYSSPKVTPLA